MSTFSQRITLNVSRSFLTAFINGDMSGLYPNEIAAIDKMYSRYEQCHALCPDNVEPSLSRCQLTDLMSDCVQLEFDVVIGGGQ